MKQFLVSFINLNKLFNIHNATNFVLSLLCLFLFSACATTATDVNDRKTNNAKYSDNNRTLSQSSYYKYVTIQSDRDRTIFKVSQEMIDNDAKLVALILQTESMENDERQYWFDIYPSMNTQQRKRLFDILETERRKLAELEKKYQNEIRALNERHLREWYENQNDTHSNINQKKDTQISEQYQVTASDGKVSIWEILKPDLWDFTPVGKPYKLWKWFKKSQKFRKAQKNARIHNQNEKIKNTCSGSTCNHY